MKSKEYSIVLLMFIILLCRNANGSTSVFVNIRNITNGSPILLGESDRLYYFTKSCQDSELSMIFFCDDSKWGTIPLPFANKTFPAFVVYDDKIESGDKDELIVYSMIMAVNGQLFQYYPISQSWKEFKEIGSTNRLQYEGSATFYNFKEGNWYSPGKPDKLYRTSSKNWEFDSSDNQFLDIDLGPNIKDMELFPLIDKIRRKTKYEKWILMVLTECGLVSYYVGEIKESEYLQQTGHHEFMMAENINDLAVTDRDSFTIFFNTYLKKSSKDCVSGEWNAVFPVLKQIQLYQLSVNSYRLNSKFYFIPTSQKHSFTKTNPVKLSPGNDWNLLAESANFYIEALFETSEVTDEIGLIVRQNPDTDSGISIGLNLKDKLYYYDKGSSYRLTQEQDYCDCGCLKAQNVTVSDDFGSKNLKLLITVLADHRVVDVNFYGNFHFTIFDFSEQPNSKISVFSKEDSTATISLYVY